MPFPHLFTCVLLFDIGLVFWAVMYGVQTLSGGDADLAQMGSVMSAVVLFAAALTVGQVAIVPLMPLAIALFVAIGRKVGQSRRLAVLLGFGCAEAFGLWLTLTRDTETLYTVSGHLFLFAIPGALAGLVFWCTLGRTRKKMGPQD